MSVLVHKAIEAHKATKVGKALYELLTQDLLNGGRRAILMPKLDGIYVQFKWQVGGTWAAFTRQGEPMPSINAVILDAFKNFGQHGRSYIGEVWMPGQPHSDINGAARRQSPQPGLEVWLHDSYREDRGALVDEPFAARLSMCQAFANLCTAHNVWAITVVEAISEFVRLDMNMVMGMARTYKAKASAYDGLMLLDRKHIFTPGSGTDGGKFKIKPRYDIDARVIGTTPGKGKHAGRLGAVVIDLGDGVECKVNLGTDEDRERTDWIGAIVEVSYLSVGSNRRLREPVLERRRDDLAEAQKLYG